LERFAFVFHPLSVRDFARKFPLLAHVPPVLVERAFAAVPPFHVAHIRGVRSTTGVTAEGDFVGLPLTPRLLLERPWEWVRPRIVRAARKAEELGAKIVGLGAFTKVVGDRGVSVAEALSIPVTTGNSYTAASSVEGALLAARHMGVDPAAATAVVVGATGSIGRAVSALLADVVGRLVLVARQEGPLREFADELTGRAAAVEGTTDLLRAVGEADIVLTVSSAPGVLLEPAHLRSGAVVCDVARPRNVSRRVYEERDDVLVIDGGVIEVPGEVDFGFDFGFPPRTAEACIAETMILALERRYECFTLGADIDIARVREIARLASKHGFRVAGFRRFERALSEAEVATIRERAERLRRSRTAPTASSSPVRGD
jgi:fatty aldehyde-generating acyl-ACP reductase